MLVVDVELVVDLELVDMEVDVFASFKDVELVMAVELVMDVELFMDVELVKSKSIKG